MAKWTVNVTGRIRNRWALRVGLWFLKLCTVEVLADGRSLGRRRVLDVAVMEWDE
jgi:hypothetical protein